MPFKANAARRHRIPKQRRRVTNWAQYDAALRQRGSLTVWFTEEAVAAWHAEPRTTPGGQPHYSSLAITTALTLKAVFRLALRQTEGLIGSIIELLGLSLAVPTFSTLSRRAGTVEVPRPRVGDSADHDADSEPLHLLVDSTGLKLCGAGEWLIEKHGTKRRRSWRKLHIGIDAGMGISDQNRDPPPISGNQQRQLFGPCNKPARLLRVPRLHQVAACRLGAGESRRTLCH